MHLSTNITSGCNTMNGVSMTECISNDSPSQTTTSFHTLKVSVRSCCKCYKIVTPGSESMHKNTMFLYPEAICDAINADDSYLCSLCYKSCEEEAVPQLCPLPPLRRLQTVYDTCLNSPVLHGSPKRMLIALSRYKQHAPLAQQPRSNQLSILPEWGPRDPNSW